MNIHLEAPGFSSPATHVSSAPTQFSTYTAQGRISTYMKEKNGYQMLLNNGSYCPTPAYVTMLMLFFKPFEMGLTQYKQQVTKRD